MHLVDRACLGQSDARSVVSSQLVFHADLSHLIVTRPSGRPFGPKTADAWGISGFAPPGTRPDQAISIARTVNTGPRRNSTYSQPWSEWRCSSRNRRRRNAEVVDEEHQSGRVAHVTPAGSWIHTEGGDAVGRNPTARRPDRPARAGANTAAAIGESRRGISGPTALSKL